MRIWDLPPALLCRKHLLGEHQELHDLWNILVKLSRGEKPGYRSHPETLRWIGHGIALSARHDRLQKEILRRGYTHQSDLVVLDGADRLQLFAEVGDPPPLHTIVEQVDILRSKGCGCWARIQNASL